jgi:hypothetical protein
LIADLRSAGVTLQAIRKVVGYLGSTSQLEHPLAEARLVVLGKDVVLARGDEELVSLLKRPGQGYLAFVVDVVQAADELREKIARMAA